MNTAKVISFETSEFLRVEIDGKIYTLKNHKVESSLTNLTLSIDELKELKKLSSDMRVHLFAKKFLNASIKEVQLLPEPKQVGFTF